MSTATATETDTVTCTRCAGTGRLEQYAHVVNGTCFACRGLGGIPVAVHTRRQRDRARREARRESDRQARLLARMAAYAEAGGTLAEWHAEVSYDPEPSEAIRADWLTATGRTS